MTMTTTIRRILLPLLLLLLSVAVPVPVLAETRIAPAMMRYDVDSGTETFCRMLGIDAANGTLGSITNFVGIIKTAGSNTTVTSNVAAAGSLTPILVGDVLLVRPATTQYVEPFTAGWAAMVTVKTDADTVTVDPAVNWSAGYKGSYYRPVCGTTTGDGWIDVAGAGKVTISIVYEQGDLDALVWRFQCRHASPGSLPETVYPSKGDTCGNAGSQATAGFCDFASASATGTSSFSWEEFGDWSQCRIGVKYKTSDTSDAGANLERVSGTITISSRNQ